MPKRDSSVPYYIDIGTTFLDGHIFRNALGGKLRHTVKLALGAIWTVLCSLGRGRWRFLHSANMLGG
jgi:hypothetical protein